MLEITSDCHTNCLLAIHKMVPQNYDPLWEQICCRYVHAGRPAKAAGKIEAADLEWSQAIASSRWMRELKLNPNCKHHCNDCNGWAMPGQRAPNSDCRPPLMVITQLMLAVCYCLSNFNVSYYQKLLQMNITLTMAGANKYTFRATQWPMVYSILPILDLQTFRSHCWRRCFSQNKVHLKGFLLNCCMHLTNLTSKIACHVQLLFAIKHN